MPSISSLEPRHSTDVVRSSISEEDTEQNAVSMRPVPANQNSNEIGHEEDYNETVSELSGEEEQMMQVMQNLRASVSKSTTVSPHSDIAADNEDKEIGVSPSVDSKCNTLIPSGRTPLLEAALNSSSDALDALLSNKLCAKDPVQDLPVHPLGVMGKQNRGNKRDFLREQISKRTKTVRSSSLQNHHPQTRKAATAQRPSTTSIADALTSRKRPFLHTSTAVPDEKKLKTVAPGTAAEVDTSGAVADLDSLLTSRLEELNNSTTVASSGDQPRLNDRHYDKRECTEDKQGENTGKNSDKKDEDRETVGAKPFRLVYHDSEDEADDQVVIRAKDTPKMDAPAPLFQASANDSVESVVGESEHASVHHRVTPPATRLSKRSSTRTASAVADSPADPALDRRLDRLAEHMKLLSAQRRRSRRLGQSTSVFRSTPSSATKNTLLTPGMQSSELGEGRKRGSSSISSSPNGGTGATKVKSVKNVSFEEDLTPLKRSMRAARKHSHGQAIPERSPSLKELGLEISDTSASSQASAEQQKKLSLAAVGISPVAICDKKHSQEAEKSSEATGHGPMSSTPVKALSPTAQTRTTAAAAPPSSVNRMMVDLETTAESMDEDASMREGGKQSQTQPQSNRPTRSSTPNTSVDSDEASASLTPRPPQRQRRRRPTTAISHTTVDAALQTEGTTTDSGVQTSDVVVITKDSSVTTAKSLGLTPRSAASASKAVLLAGDEASVVQAVLALAKRPVTRVQGLPLLDARSWTLENRKGPLSAVDVLLGDDGWLNAQISLPAPRRGGGKRAGVSAKAKLRAAKLAAKAKARALVAGQKRKQIEAEQVQQTTHTADAADIDCLLDRAMHNAPATPIQAQPTSGAHSRLQRQLMAAPGRLAPHQRRAAVQTETSATSSDLHLDLGRVETASEVSSAAGSLVHSPRTLFTADGESLSLGSQQSDASKTSPSQRRFALRNALIRDAFVVEGRGLRTESSSTSIPGHGPFPSAARDLSVMLRTPHAVYRLRWARSVRDEAALGASNHATVPGSVTHAHATLAALSHREIHTVRRDLESLLSRAEGRGSESERIDDFRRRLYSTTAQWGQGPMSEPSSTSSHVSSSRRMEHLARELAEGPLKRRVDDAPAPVRDVLLRHLRQD
eukprot:Clim_evm7s46 gene=Clim_evmTU7s46